MGGRRKREGFHILSLCIFLTRLPHQRMCLFALLINRLCAKDKKNRESDRSRPKNFIALCLIRSRRKPSTSASLPAQRRPSQVLQNTIAQYEKTTTRGAKKPSAKRRKCLRKAAKRCGVAVSTAPRQEKKGYAVPQKAMRL